MRDAATVPHPADRRGSVTEHDGSVGLSNRFDVPPILVGAVVIGLGEGLLGLTLVAFGTSLPELVTAVHATRRGEDELVLGNVLGSNVFNSLLSGAMLAVIAPGATDDTKLATRGVAVMVMVAVFGWASMARCRRISRPSAVTLLSGYLAAVVVTA